MQTPNPDAEHLRLLSIFHYVVGGLIGLFSLLPLIHVGLGVLMLAAPDTFADKNQGPPPALIGWIFAIGGGVVIVLGLSLAVVTIIAGRYLGKRKRRMFCLVVAALECIFMPFGTVLGIFTIIVLMRNSVQRAFELPTADESPNPPLPLGNP